MPVRITLKQYLSLHLIFGLILSALCIWMFHELAEAITSRSLMTQFDTALAEALHEGMTPQTVQAYHFITLFGMQIVHVLTVLVSIYYAYKRLWLRLGVWLTAIAGGQVLNYLLKAVFDRPRPTFAQPFAVEANASFPSGHAMMAVITYGMLAYFTCRRVDDRRLRLVIIFTAVVIVLLIGISRMTLGVHYFSDVVAGYLAGGVWLITFITAMEHIRYRRSLNEPG
jgi:membrane-associated phospholipid phosphatase